MNVGTVNLAIWLRCGLVRLDSGAQVSVIGNNKGYKLMKPGGNITMGDGALPENIGTIYINICADNYYHKIGFKVIPSIHNNFILGMDFWKKSGLVSLLDNRWLATERKNIDANITVCDSSRATEGEDLIIENSKLNN